MDRTKVMAWWRFASAEHGEEYCHVMAGGMIAMPEWLADNWATSKAMVGLAVFALI